MLKVAQTLMSSRVITGDPWRKSRLHDMRDNFIGTRGLVEDLPRVTIESVLRRAMGRYPPRPWIPYPAIRAFAPLLRPDWRVLEHGSGMSTIWWAERVASVFSIEANPAWHRRVQRELRKRHLVNATVELASPDTFGDLSRFPDNTFNLVVIDGHAREQAARQARRLLTRPGWIYLDNSDFAAQWHEMYGEAEDVLREAAQRDGAELTYFTGLPPATMVATQGLLIGFGR